MLCNNHVTKHFLWNLETHNIGKTFHHTYRPCNRQRVHKCRKRGIGMKKHEIDTKANNQQRTAKTKKIESAIEQPFMFRFFF